MAWETRDGGNQYFYLNQRLPDGRIRKKYFGNGLLAEVESLRLDINAVARHQLATERQLTATGESLLKQHLCSTRDVTHALMLSIGFNNERSRGWRPIPMISLKETDQEYNQENELENSQEHDGNPADEDQLSFEEMVKAARNGDPSVIPTLRKILWDNPKLIKHNGDLASQTMIHWIDLIAGRNLYYRETLLLRVFALREVLFGETNGTLVEKMLAEQAMSTWLQLYYHEDREATDPAENIKVGEFRLKKIESAFNRHMRSLNALASMRTINFTKRMVETMQAAVPDTVLEHYESGPKAVPHTFENRIRDRFSRSLEPVPMH